mmetsp:Transcript_66971/g.217981  ORF Transcript_66971/g.217981 Transcript_66971/m.217981 type:complete len:219 (+) Transcript_66971:302-958(+)
MLPRLGSPLRVRGQCWPERRRSRRRLPRGMPGPEARPPLRSTPSGGRRRRRPRRAFWARMLGTSLRWALQRWRSRIGVRRQMKALIGAAVPLGLLSCLQGIGPPPRGQRTVASPLCILLLQTTGAAAATPGVAAVAVSRMRRCRRSVRWTSPRRCRIGFTSSASPSTSMRPRAGAPRMAPPASRRSPKTWRTSPRCCRGSRPSSGTASSRTASRRWRR